MTPSTVINVVFAIQFSLAELRLLLLVQLSYRTSPAVCTLGDHDLRQRSTFKIGLRSLNNSSWLSKWVVYVGGRQLYRHVFSSAITYNPKDVNILSTRHASTDVTPWTSLKPAASLWHCCLFWYSPTIVYAYPPPPVPIVGPWYICLFLSCVEGVSQGHSYIFIRYRYT